MAMVVVVLIIATTLGIGRLTTEIWPCNVSGCPDRSQGPENVTF